MIKIIQEERHTCSCSVCNAILEFEPSDIRYGAFGCAYIICPKCHNTIELYEYDKELTIDELRFPLHYSMTFTDAPTPKEVDNGVKEAVKNFKKCIKDDPSVCEYRYSANNLDISLHRDTPDDNIIDIQVIFSYAESMVKL
jgi:hypothetical protein